MTKKIYLYRLTDALGLKHLVVLNESNDCGCIGGFDKDGNYQQYDSYELYHAYAWAEKHGFKLESGSMNVEVPESVFKHE